MLHGGIAAVFRKIAGDDEIGVRWDAAIAQEKHGYIYYGLTGAIVIGSDYALNPFRHKYHPDHDNLDAKFNPITDPASKEAYAITRQLQFEIGAGVGNDSTTPDPVYSFVDGVYLETLTGLHKQPIKVAGTFRLTRASLIAELNPSPTP